MKKLLLLLFFLCTIAGYAEIKVVTTTTVIFDLVKEIGKEKVKVDFLCRGDQDPHYLEILPSYMLKLKNADLCFKIGMGLELWLPQLIDGSRNEDLKIIDLSENINKKEVPAGKLDASMGDIHPQGNPHYWLDPENAKVMVNEIYSALSSFSSKDEKFFKKNFDDYLNRLDGKIKTWTEKMKPLNNKPIIFFHSSWVYFAERFNLKIAGYVEPKPGITPTPSHNSKIISLIKEKNIKLIVMENFYSDRSPSQISRSTGIKVLKVPIAVFGTSEAGSYIELIEFIINKLTQNA